MFSEDFQSLPPVTRSLLDHLDEKWSLKVFMDLRSMDEVAAHQGRVEVIEYLRYLLQLNEESPNVLRQ